MYNVSRVSRSATAARPQYQTTAMSSNLKGCLVTETWMLVQLGEHSALAVDFSLR